MADFSPAHSELLKQLNHRGGNVAGRRTTESDTWGKARIGTQGLDEGEERLIQQPALARVDHR